MAHIGETDELPADTFPKLLIHHAGRRGGRIAMREKDLGIWQCWTWRQYLDEVRALAGGLAAEGFAHGDKAAIIGDNRPHLYWAIAAVQCLGGVPVPIYQDSTAEEMAFIVDHAEARFAVVEDQEQVDKMLAIAPDCPRLERVIAEDMRGMRHYRETILQSYAEVQDKGRRFNADNPRFLDDEIAKAATDDIAIISYTSGTTGRPKGVMLSHRNLLATSRNANARDRLRDNEEAIAYMPMAWIGDHIFSYGQALTAGFAVNCPESGATVMQDAREIGPTYFFAPPRIWENILTSVMVRIEDAAAVKRWLFHRFMAVARRVGERKLAGKRVGPADNLLYALGELTVYGPLKDNLGFRRIRVAYTAGEAIGPEIFNFYRSLGINIKQIYGMTEGSALVCGQLDDKVSAETVGIAMPEVEIRIAEDGEVQFRGPGVFLGYYKDPEATAEALTTDGWLRSGDAGFFDDDGQLHIIDRAKDVGRLATGAMFAPKYIENKLKFSPYVREAVAHGQGRRFVAAFVNIDLEAVGNWAERNGLSYTSYTDLAGRPEVYDLIEREIERVNRDLAHEPQLAGSQVHRFLILHKELDPDDAELTRTRKVRRGFVAEKYAQLIEAMYEGAGSVPVEARVQYEDGRTGTIRADVAIRDVAVSAPVARAKASGAWPRSSAISATFCCGPRTSGSASGRYGRSRT